MADQTPKGNHVASNIRASEDPYFYDDNIDDRQDEQESRLSAEEEAQVVEGQTKSTIHISGQKDGISENRDISSAINTGSTDEDFNRMDTSENAETFDTNPITEDASVSVMQESGLKTDIQGETSQLGSSGRATGKIVFERPNDDDSITSTVSNNEPVGETGNVTTQGTAFDPLFEEVERGLRENDETEQNEGVEEKAAEDNSLDQSDKGLTEEQEQQSTAPSAEDDYTVGNEDSVIAGNVLTNDSDVDGSITVKDTGTFETANGSITIDAAGNYTYTPDANYNGPDSFEYTIIDDDGAEATATLNLTVEDINDGPVATDDSNSGDEDTLQTGNVLTNDSDIDGTITVKNTGTFETANGSITIDAAGNYTYTPDANYNGSDSFDYTVIDDDGAEATATLNLTVEEVNDGPTVSGVELQNTSGSLSLNNEGSTGNVALLSDLDNFPTNALTIQINFSSIEAPVSTETNGISLVSYAVNGTDNEFLLFAEPNGGLSVYINSQRYPLDLAGNDIFDGDNHDLAVSWDSSTGEVSVYVDGNQTDSIVTTAVQPITAGGTLTLGQEQDSVGGGFVSSQEFSGEFHSVEVFSGVRTAGEISSDVGIAPLQDESSLVLSFDFSSDEPLNNLAGNEVFSLDGGAFIAGLDDGAILEDGEGINGQIAASDVDGNDLSFSLKESPSEGIVTIEADGSFHFSPGNDFQDLGVGESREVSFEIEVADGQGGFDTQTVTVTVVGQNDGPVAEAFAFQTDEDNSYEGQLTASDVDGDDLSFSLYGQPAEGSVTVNEDGSFSFSPNNDFEDLGVGESRDVSFSYQVSDNHGGTSIENVTVTVTGTNDAPVIGGIVNVVGSLDDAEFINGSAMSFNEGGRSGDVAVVENIDDFPTDALTVELRFSSTEAPDAGETNGVSLFSYNVASGDNEFLIFSDSSGSLGVYINGQRTLMDVDMNSLYDGEYHHLAVLWDSENGEISVYVDGDLTDTAIAQAGNPIQSGGTLALGQEQDSVGGGFVAAQQFSGKIADVQVFDEARGADLIESDSSSVGIAVDDDSLVHAYDFSNSEDNTVIDQGSGNDMDFTGAVIIEDAGLPKQVGELDLIVAEDGAAITGTLTASDVEGDELSFSLVTGTDEGTVTVDENGNFEFNPGGDFQDLGVGEARDVSFEYQVDDGNGGVETATATITVTGANDGPISSDNEILIQENGSYIFDASDFSFADVDGDDLSHVTITETPTNGVLELNGVAVEAGDEIAAADLSGLVYEPETDTNGMGYGDFKFTVNDGTSNSAEQSFSIDVVAPDGTMGLASSNGIYDISGGGEVTINVNYLSSDAGYNNSHGYYLADADGNPIGGAIIEDNVKDFSDNTITFNTDDYPGAESVGFFIVPDGNDENSGLSGGEVVTFEQIDGVWTPMVDGEALEGAQAAPAYFSDASLNADGIDHLIDDGMEGNQNWEDLYGGGDKDFHDINADVSVSILPKSGTIIQGASGAEDLQGGAGGDTLHYNSDGTWSGYSAYNVETGDKEALAGYNRSSDVFDGGDGHDTIEGTSGDDALFLDDGISSFASGSQARIQNVEEINMGDGNDIVDMTSSKYTYDQGVEVSGGDGDDIIWTSTGNDKIDGGAGNDQLFGGEGNDVLTFLAHQGNDIVDGGEGGAWTDTIELNGFDGQSAQEGWTLSLNDGSSVTSTDELNGEIVLSGDAGGTITFDDGGSIDFENIEKIVW